MSLLEDFRQIWYTILYTIRYTIWYTICMLFWPNFSAFPSHLCICLHWQKFEHCIALFITMKSLSVHIPMPFNSIQSRLFVFNLITFVIGFNRFDISIYNIVCSSLLQVNKEKSKLLCSENFPSSLSS